MKNVLTVLVVLVTLALVGGFVLAQSGNDLFQQALVKERAGSYQEAIKLYQTIVQKNSSDRKLAAKALFQIGQAYEKLGNAEALKAYERIAREFADQKDVAADASRRLVVLDKVQEFDISAPRLVVTGSVAAAAESVSPDGRWMTMADWDNHGISIRDMSTGQITRITASPGNDLQHTVLSPDLKHVAYLHFIDANDEAQLRVINNEADGKPLTLLRPNSEVEYFEPSGWSSDGKSILVTINKSDHTWEIAWVSVSDGSIKPILSLDWRLPRGQHSLPRLSADGKYIAFSALATNPSKFPPAATDPTDQHIYVVATDGSNEIELVKTSGINDSPVWTPDGTHILYTSNSSGSFDLRSVVVRNGKTELVRRDVGKINPIGITHSGSFYYVRRQQIEQILTAPMEPNGKIDGQRAIGADAHVGFRSQWSPDGRFIAFLRHHPGSGDNYDVVVHSLESGTETVYSRSGIQPGPPLWFHDNKGLLVVIRHENGAKAPYRIDRDTHEFRQMLKESVSYPPYTWLMAISPNDKTIYIAASSPTERLNQIVPFDLATQQQGQPVVLPQGTQGFYAFSLSPDSRTFAMWHPTHLARIGVDGNDYRELYTYSTSDRRWTNVGTGEVVWTKDSRGILVTKLHGEVLQIIRISSEGGDPESTGLEVQKSDLIRGGSIDVSPDGSRFAYSITSTTTELWAIDKLPSRLKD